MAVGHPERRRARGQRHRDLRQRREGRSVVPARVAGASSRTTSSRAPGRHRLLDRRRSSACNPGRARTARPRDGGGGDSTPTAVASQYAPQLSVPHEEVGERDQQHSGDARHHQDVPRREGALERQLRGRARRGPRHLRRERRRQVHAHEGAVGRLPARHLRRRHRLRGRDGRVPRPHATARPRASSSSTRSWR